MANLSLIKGFFVILFHILLILQKTTFAQIIFPNEDVDVEYFGRCLTPNKERSLCVKLEDCKYLFDILTKSPLKDSDRLFLSRSQCGYQNGNVLVCCPKAEPNLLPTLPPKHINNNLPHPGECGNVLSNRIYGGNRTKIDEFPWMALIEYTKANNAKGHHCGGSLINTRYVLTASHCVNGNGIPADWRLTGVRLGEWNTKTNPDCEIDVRGQKDCAPEHVDIAVERAIPHSQYDPNSRNQVHDIALLRLQRSILYTDFIRPICLPVSNNLRSVGFDGIVMDIAGWGKTEKESVSNFKLKASVEGYSFEECRAVYQRQNIFLEDSQICAGGKEGTDSCRGDSGGPLISLDTTNRVRAYYFLAGVVSFGPTPCGLEGWPGVYTRVGNYIDWILQNMTP